MTRRVPNLLLDACGHYCKQAWAGEQGMPTHEALRNTDARGTRLPVRPGSSIPALWDHPPVYRNYAWWLNLQILACTKEKPHPDKAGAPGAALPGLFILPSCLCRFSCLYFTDVPDMGRPSASCTPTTKRTRRYTSGSVHAGPTTTMRTTHLPQRPNAGH